jgi:hypothetical protein
VALRHRLRRESLQELAAPPPSLAS